MSPIRLTPAFALLLATSAFSVVAPSPARAQEAKVAIANPLKIVSQIQEYQDTVAKIAARRDAQRAEVQQRQDKLKAMQGELQMLNPGTKEYDAKNNDVQKGAIEYDVWARVTDQANQREQKQMTRSLMDKVQVAIAAVAKQKGIDVVIADQAPEIPADLDKVELQTLNELILRRTIWYSDGKLDITEEVKVYLDRQYNSTKTGGAPAGGNVPLTK